MTTFGLIETFSYFFIWTSGIAISLYHLYGTGKIFERKEHAGYLEEDFEEGWTILDRKKDVADYEWNVWTVMTINLLPWLILNLLGAEILRYRKLNKYLSLWYFSITFGYTMLSYNHKVACLFFVNALSFYFITILFKSQLSLWILSFFIRNVMKAEEYVNIREDQQYLVMLSSSWMLLRCICFCIDHLNSNEKMSHTDFFVKLLGYSFYLPTMFAGPLILYKEFHSNINSNFENWDLNRFLKFGFQLIRCLFWYFFTEFSLHYIYVNVIVLRPYIVEQMSVWELAGLGYAMGHFFLLKYIVFYGVPCAWASAERYQTPDPPCCVSRVHLYSYMWRNFDQGLYKFIVRYIYSPLLSYSKYINKTVASLICFSFIFLWHGGETYVLYWTILNFIAISIEAAGKKVIQLEAVKNIISKNFQPSNWRRVQCLLAAPLHYFSMVANYFFIGCGTDIGLIFFKQFLLGNVFDNFIILFFLYGASQSAVSIELWQKKKKI